MKVRAISQGFHGKLREVGEEFTVEQGRKASWYVAVGREPAEIGASEGGKSKAKTKAPAKDADGTDDLV